MTAFYILSLGVFVWYVGHLATRMARPSLVEWLLCSFMLFTSSIIATGFVLSALNLTNNAPTWAISVFIPATVLSWFFKKIVPPLPHFSPLSLLQQRGRIAGRWYQSLTPFLKYSFLAMALTLLIVGVTNLLLVLFTVPNVWDSMTGHLNRAMQYVQRGTMAHFGGTNWNMDTYPKSVCTIQIYSFLMTGRFENAFKFIHFLSYWVVLVAVFGIAQRIAKNLSASFFCALSFALFPNFLIQATATETDNVLAAYFSSLLYFVFSFRNTREPRYLYWAALCFGVALGHKITFVLLWPSLFVIMGYAVFIYPKSVKFQLSRILKVIDWLSITKLGVAIVICVCIWGLPTGYLKNVEVFGHPIGPPTALKHQSIERATSNGGLRNLFEQGSRNVVRYAYDFVNLDGLRNIAVFEKANQTMRKPLIWLEGKLKMRLDETTEFTIGSFRFSQPFYVYYANPYWGILGFALIFPLIFLVLVGLVRSPVHFVLAVAFLLHFAALSYSAPYDPWKGRYFQQTALFGVLFLTLFFSKKISLEKSNQYKLLKTYVGALILTVCVSAILLVFLNIRSLPLAALGRPSAFNTDRLTMMTFSRPDTEVAYKRFEELVPDTATVALGTINDDFEYPLFGKNLTRRLIPINPFEQGLQPIPKEAQYLFFSKNVIKPLPTDIRLGTDTTMTEGVVVAAEDYYLRILK